MCFEIVLKSRMGAVSIYIKELKWNMFLPCFEIKTEVQVLG